MRPAVAGKPDVVEGPRERLFFALWPDAGVRSRLARLQACVTPPAARTVRAANLHMTLVFVGDADEALRDRLLDHAARVVCSPFDMALCRTGCFRGGILWSAPEQVPPALLRLAASLGEAVRAAGATPEHRPFRAHVTLARRAVGGQADAAHPAIAWRVREFGLYASRRRASGAVYVRHAAWPLV